MSVKREQAEVFQSVEFFENTDIPKLSLEQDADWLSLVAAPNKIINPELVDQLNEQVAISHSKVIAARELAVEKQWRTKTAKPTGIGYYKDIPSVQTQAKSRFFIQLGAYSEESALFPIVGRIKGASLPTIIANSRLLYAYLGVQLPMFLEHSQTTLSHQSHRIARRLDLIEAEGYDVAEILMKNTQILISGRVGDEVAFVKRLKGVRATPNKRASRRIARAEKFTAPLARAETAEDTLSDEAVARYRALAGLTNIQLPILERGLPEVKGLDEKRMKFLTKRITALVESADDDIRLRDILPLVESLNEK